MAAGRDHRRVVEFLANVAVQRILEVGEGGERRIEPVGGIRNVECCIHEGRKGVTEKGIGMRFESRKNRGARVA